MRHISEHLIWGMVRVRTVFFYALFYLGSVFGLVTGFAHNQGQDISDHVASRLVASVAVVAIHHLAMVGIFVGMLWLSSVLSDRLNGSGTWGEAKGNVRHMIAAVLNYFLLFVSVSLFSITPMFSLWVVTTTGILPGVEGLTIDHIMYGLGMWPLITVSFALGYKTSRRFEPRHRVGPRIINH